MGFAVRSRNTYVPIESGDKFGNLTVVERGEDYWNPSLNKPTHRWWLKCDCGKEVLRHQSQLHSGQSKDCGCGRKFQDIPIGAVFGKLTVTGLAKLNGGKRKIPCKCECGAETEPFSFSLTSGKTLSCGTCDRKCSPNVKRAIAQANTKHGWHGSSEYNTWLAMRKRCGDPNNKAYRNYGARGIKVCAEWQDNFQAFIDYIGPKPDADLSLDRIDNERGYEPGNVRWADAQTQNRNRRPFTIVSGSKPLSERR